MGGHSGSAVASHTRLVRCPSSEISRGNWCVVTAPQARLIERCNRGTVHIFKHEVRSARKLEEMDLGLLRDDGELGPGGNFDGERWTFTVHADIELR